MKHGDITYVDFDVVMVLGKKYGNIDDLIAAYILERLITVLDNDKYVE